MAKLPKVKSKTEEVEEELGTTNEPETSEDQTDAVTGIIDRATETVAGSEEGAETGESEETDSGEEPNEESPKQEDDETSGDDNFGVTITAPKPAVSTKATTVKVATVCDHSCHIGGKPYHFKKGVPTSVPEPVKQILKNAGLLAAL